MAIFNEYGNLYHKADDVANRASGDFWNQIKPLLDGLTVVEARALEQSILQGISVRFGEHRLRTQLDKSRAERANRVLPGPAHPEGGHKE